MYELVNRMLKIYEGSLIHSFFNIGCTNLSELNPYTQNPTKKLKYNWNTP